MFKDFFKSIINSRNLLLAFPYIACGYMYVSNEITKIAYKNDLVNFENAVQDTVRVKNILNT